MIRADEVLGGCWWPASHDVLNAVAWAIIVFAWLWLAALACLAISRRRRGNRVKHIARWKRERSLRKVAQRRRETERACMVRYDGRMLG